MEKLRRQLSPQAPANLEAATQTQQRRLSTSTSNHDRPPPYQALNGESSSSSNSGLLAPGGRSSDQLLQDGAGSSFQTASGAAELGARQGKRQIYGPAAHLAPPFEAYPAASNEGWEGDLLVPSVAKQADRPRRRLLGILAAPILILIVLAVVLPVYFAVVKPRKEVSTQSGKATRGTNGSTVVTANGTSFVYLNPFGGFWVDDPDKPYDDSAQPNSWTPPLNTSWDFETNRIHGVSLGGLFVLEPFITPALFQKYPNTIDEWSLSIAMANDSSQGGGLGQIEDHYKTFITEKDIADIASAGLTWVRVPVGFWAIETFPGEPFLAKTSWKYVVTVLQWCRKYGLRVNLVLNVAPGSQNGFNNGGKVGVQNFLSGVMGMANAERTLYYLRVLIEFVAQPEWTNVVPMLSVLNEPTSSTMGMPQLRSFYVEAHSMIREITGYGAGKGPFLVFQDGFDSDAVFNGFMNGADRAVLDRHAYVAFSSVAADSVSAGTISQACSTFGPSMNTSRSQFGITIAGEFSAAFMDCGLFVNGVGINATYGGDCDDWENSQNWGPGIKSSLIQFVAAQMDATIDSFFFTWKIGASAAGVVESPLWSYQLGLQEGWINEDPRKSVGVCQSLNGTSDSAPGWNGTYASWMTGGEGAFVATDAASYPWPPSTLSHTGTATSLALPTYTTTGTPLALPQPTYTDSKGSTVPVSNAIPVGRVPAPTPVSGCVYPDAWNATDVVYNPAMGCGAPL